MAVLDKKTFNQIVNLLEPFASTTDERQLLVTNAFMSIATPPDIDYEGASLAVRERIVIALVQQGRIKQVNSQALWMLLRHIYDDVGFEQKTYIDNIQRKINVYKLVLHSDILPPEYPEKLTFEQENRKRLIENVQRTWLDGVLSDALRDAELDIDLKSTPEQVEQARFSDYVLPVTISQRQGDNFTPLANAGDVIDVIFHDVDKKLLILGAPGSGKTVLLLQLAQALLDEATPINDVPIPIIVNLSSWAIKREAMKDWVIEELQRSTYGIPKKLAKQLVGTNKLIFLLDGLDEVAEAHRDACVMGINAFMTEDRQLAICSRIEEYEQLADKLNTHTALQVQPLTNEQVQAYLSERLQPKMVKNILSVVQADATIWQEVNKPLFINILISTYRDRPTTSLPAVSGEILQKMRKRAIQQVRNMKIQQEQKRAIARQLVIREAVYQLVIEPYIKRQLEKAPINIPYNHEATRRYLGYLGWQMNWQDMTAFYIEELQVEWLPYKSESNVNTISRLLVTLAGGWDSINLNKKIKWNAFSRARLRKGLFYGLLGGLPIMIVLRLIGILLYGGSRGLIYELVYMLGNGVVLGGGTGVFGWLFYGFFSAMIATGEDIPLYQRSRPNQGLSNTLFSGLFFGLINGLIIGVATWHWGLIFGLLSGLIYGLRDVNRHLTLRGLLWRSGVAPRRYDKFLFYAKDRRLMRQVGGGFIFLHRYLLEYFADWYERKYINSEDTMH